MLGQHASLAQLEGQGTAGDAAAATASGLIAFYTCSFWGNYVSIVVRTGQKRESAKNTGYPYSMEKVS